MDPVIQTITHIQLLTKFFFNYSKEDIETLCTNRQFNHFWQFKRHEFDDKDDTYKQLTYAFFSYFSDEMRALVLNYAVNQFKPN